jgi:hypothetical protein
MTADKKAESLVERFKRQAEFVPEACYDPDGDCIEFIISQKPFKGKRLSKWVTVYYAHVDSAIVGSCIKDVKKLLNAYPGLDIDIISGQVRLSHILRAPAWSEGDPVKRESYKAVIDEAEKFEISADLEELVRS